MTNREMAFADRNEFRVWLQTNCRSGEGLFVVFEKSDNPGFKHAEAVEEALCFGWIDGVLRSKNPECYAVYFCERTPRSGWSPKNIQTVGRLEEQGRMTDYGREKVAQAKANGSWDHPLALPAYDETQTAILIQAIGEIEPARSNFLNMSPSVKRTYTLMYLDAKTEETRRKRLQKIVERLNENKKPM